MEQDVEQYVDQTLRFYQCSVLKYLEKIMDALNNNDTDKAKQILAMLIVEIRNDSK